MSTGLLYIWGNGGFQIRDIYIRDVNVFVSVLLILFFLVRAVDRSTSTIVVSKYCPIQISEPSYEALHLLFHLIKTKLLRGQHRKIIWGSINFSAANQVQAMGSWCALNPPPLSGKIFWSSKAPRLTSNRWSSDVLEFIFILPWRKLKLLPTQNLYLLKLV